VYTHQLALIADQHASRSPAKAVLLEDAPAGSQRVRGSPATIDVRAYWVSASGIRHEANAPARYGDVKGTAVDIWLNDNGDLAAPPRTRQDAAVSTVSTAVGAWLACVFALFGAFMAMRALLNRARHASWEREWRRISRGAIWP
jgi:hypothetical protein